MKRVVGLVGFLPALVYAQTVGLDQALLQWDASTGAVLNYHIERKPVACATTGTWTEIAKLPATTLQYLDTGLKPGTTYCWRAFASNATDKSGPSNEVFKAMLQMQVPLNPRLQK